MSEPEVWEACEEEWRYDSSTCGHTEQIWLARWNEMWEDPPAEIWCRECHLTDQFPSSWVTITDFQIQVAATGSSMVHLADY